MSEVKNIPEGWEQTEIGSLVDLAQGVAINAKTNHVLSDKENGIPLLKINNLLNNTIDQYANPTLVPKQSIIHKKDVIFTRTGQVGEVLFNKYGILHNNSFKVIPKDELHWKYLYWYLKSERVYNYVQKVAAGSVQKDLNHSAFKTIEFRYPKSINEQKSIADILTAFDNKIELLQAQNKTLEETAQTIFKEWFGKYKIEDELPEGWRVGKLEDVITIKYGKDHKHLKDGNFPLYGSGGVMRFVEKPLYEKESILIPRKGTLSNLFYLSQPFWSVDTMFYSKILKSYFGRFIFLFLKTIDLTSMNVGSAVPSLTTQVLNQIPLVIPEDEIIIKFDNVVKSIYRKLESNNLQIQTLTKTRDELLPRLMSGEIRVKS